MNRIWLIKCMCIWNLLRFISLKYVYYLWVNGWRVTGHPAFDFYHCWCSANIFYHLFTTRVRTNSWIGCESDQPEDPNIRTKSPFAIILAILNYTRSTWIQVPDVLNYFLCITELVAHCYPSTLVGYYFYILFDYKFSLVFFF